MASTHIRLTLRYLEILDRKDLDMHGEFVFEFAGSVPERDVRQAVRVPDSGHLSISDHPSMNKITLDKLVFEGEVQDGESFVFEATGEELDQLTANDELTPYRREFSGAPSSWAGSYTPWDEGSAESADPEQLGDWRIAYDIEVL